MTHNRCHLRRLLSNCSPMDMIKLESHFDCMLAIWNWMAKSQCVEMPVNLLCHPLTLLSCWKYINKTLKHKSLPHYHWETRLCKCLIKVWPSSPYDIFHSCSLTTNHGFLTPGTWIQNNGEMRARLSSLGPLIFIESRKSDTRADLVTFSHIRFFFLYSLTQLKSSNGLINAAFCQAL